MYEFQILTMDCNHCASTVTKAIRKIDPNAIVKVDLMSQMVRVEGQSGAEQIEEAINAAGYTPLRQYP